MAKFRFKQVLDAIASIPRRTVQLARLLIPRAYALAILGVLCWLTFMAIRYLYVSLVTPATAPPQITQLPTRLDAALLETGRAEWQALAATEMPRTPPSHYHRIDGWITPDHFNDCTRSGCHSALPHTRNKAARAFLNMHATSIHCGVCHMQGDERPRPLVWYDLTDGKTTDPPAILGAYGMIQSADAGKRWAEPTAADQKTLVGLLRTAAKQARAVPALNTLADHFAAVSPGSPMFQTLLSEARDTLPRHFRGEYGAKLAVKNPATGNPILGHPNTDQAVRSYFAQKDRADEQTRKRLLESVHPLRRKEALSCSDCHRTQDALVNFAGVGFPQARIDALVAPIVVKMIDHLREGSPAFTMPEFIAPKSPTTQNIDN